MSESVVIVICGLCIIINAFLFHLQSKRDGFANPILLMAVFFVYIGTIIIVLVFLVDFLDEFYKKDKS